MSAILVTILTTGCITVLITLLVIKEIIRAYNGERTEEWMRKLNYAITPLLALFGILVLLQFLQML
jgi:hypothetical protein